MSYATPETEPLDGAAEGPDPSVLRAERRLRLLEELSEIGMDLARALRDHALGEAIADPAAGEKSPTQTHPAARRDPADAFSRLSRAIRLTLALEAKTDKALRALKAGVDEARERRRLAAAERARLAGEARLRDRQEQVRLRVLDVAEADVKEDADWERLEAELDERLMADEAFWSDPGRPLREVVERYCAYFSLAPDWSRWAGEDWAPPAPPGPSHWPWAARVEPAGGPPTRRLE